MRNGRSKSSDVVDLDASRKSLGCNFLLINSNSCPILPCTRNITDLLLKTVTLRIGSEYQGVGLRPLTINKVYNKAKYDCHQKRNADVAHFSSEICCAFMHFMQICCANWQCTVQMHCKLYKPERVIWL